MAITKFDVDFKFFKRKLITLSGTVKVEGALAARAVHLYKESTGELVASVVADPSTGVWSIEVSNNTHVKYYAICIAQSGSRNNEVFGHLTGV